MSQENVEVVRREYDALAARDWTAIAKLWHPDIELEQDPSEPGAGIYRGHQEITQFFDTWAELYSTYRVEAEEIVDAEDQVVVAERFAGKGPKGRQLGRMDRGEALSRHQLQGRKDLASEGVSDSGGGPRSRWAI